MRKFSFFPALFLVLLFVNTGCSEDKKTASSSLLFPYYDKNPEGGFLPHFKYTAGYIDTAGNKVIKNDYVFAEPFTERLGCVGIETDAGVRYGYIDSAANFVIAATYYGARPFHCGRAWVEFEDYKWGVIDHNGNLITEAKYDGRSTDYYADHCIAYENVGSVERWFFGSYTETIYDVYKIDLEGNAIRIDSSTSNTDHGNYLNVRLQNNLGMFWDTEDFNRENGYGFKRISIDDYTSLNMNYDHKGTDFIDAIYSYAENFEHGYARVTFDTGEKGYIDTNGRVVVRFREERPY